MSDGCVGETWGSCLLAFADSNYEMLHKLVFIIARLSVCLSFCLRERNEHIDGRGHDKLATFSSRLEYDGNYILMHIILLLSQPYKDIQ